MWWICDGYVVAVWLHCQQIPQSSNPTIFEQYHIIHFSDKGPAIKKLMPLVVIIEVHNVLQDF